MRISRVSYKRNAQIEPFTHETVECEALLEPGDDPDEAYASCREFVEKKLRLVPAVSIDTTTVEPAPSARRRVAGRLSKLDVGALPPAAPTDPKRRKLGKVVLEPKPMYSLADLASSLDLEKMMMGKKSRRSR